VDLTTAHAGREVYGDELSNLEAMSHAVTSLHDDSMLGVVLTIKPSGVPPVNAGGEPTFGRSILRTHGAAAGKRQKYTCLVGFAQTKAAGYFRKRDHTFINGHRRNSYP
jgi:hypothetical protein